MVTQIHHKLGLGLRDSSLVNVGNNGATTCPSPPLCHLFPAVFSFLVMVGGPGIGGGGREVCTCIGIGLSVGGYWIWFGVSGGWGIMVWDRVTGGRWLLKYTLT